MLRGWSDRSFPCALMRVNCVLLLLLAQHTTSKAQAAQPDTYTWQIEQIGEAPIPGDCNGDHQVNDQDYTVYAACETGPGIPYDPANLPAGCTSPVTGDFIAADFDKDGDVDTDDYDVIVAHFDTPTAALLTGMESWDTAYVFHDIPDCYFPMQMIASTYYIGLPDAGVDDAVWTIPLFISGNGTTGYSIESMRAKQGVNRLPLDSVDCGNCDMYLWEGPGLYLGLMPVMGGWVGTSDDSTGAPIDTRTLALATSVDGIWWSYNYIAESVDGQPGTFNNAFDLANADAPGNLAMRAEFKPLCPNRVGDTNWIFEWDSLVGDCQINEDDLYWLQACKQGPGVSTFGTYCDYVDLDNDHDVDNDDEAILMQNWTGDALVQCPVIGFAWPGESTWRYDTMYWDQTWNSAEQPVDNVLLLANTGTGDMSYSITSSVPWITFTPSEGVLTTDGDNWGLTEVTVHFNTPGLPIGTYTADMIVTASDAANSPRTVFNIAVTITPPGGGDCDGDNDVDMDDFNLLIPCISGPAIPVATGCGYADFDRDGDADQDDFGAWQKNFDPWHVSPSSASAPPPQNTFLIPTTFGLPWWNERDIASRTGAVPDIQPMFDYIMATQLTRWAIGVVLLALIASFPIRGAMLANYKLECGIFTYEARNHGIYVNQQAPQNLQDDIAAALTMLRNTGNPDAIECVNWYEGQNNFNMHWRGFNSILICINTTGADNNTDPAAVTEKRAGPTVYLHQTYVMPGHTHRDRYGIRGIALLLFSEWMHQRESPDWYKLPESEHRTLLENWRTAVGWENVAPEIVHGEGEMGL